MKQTAVLRFCLGGLIGVSAFTAGFLAYPLEGLMIWFARIIISWAFISCAFGGGWIALHHIVWWRQRRRTQSISTRAARPVGNQAETGSASALCTHCQVKARDEGTAPVDRAPLPVPGEQHPPLRLTT